MNPEMQLKEALENKKFGDALGIVRKECDYPTIKVVFDNECPTHFKKATLKVFLKKGSEVGKKLHLGVNSAKKEHEKWISDFSMISPFLWDDIKNGESLRKELKSLHIHAFKNAKLVGSNGYCGKLLNEFTLNYPQLQSKFCPEDFGITRESFGCVTNPQRYPEAIHLFEQGKRNGEEENFPIPVTESM